MIVMTASSFSVDLIRRPELQDRANEFLDRHVFHELQRTRDVASLIILGGDRIRVCDEAYMAHDNQDGLIGLVTMAPLGEAENGQAGIVGCVVASNHQRRGVGVSLMQHAIRRLEERIQAGEEVDGVSMRGLIRIDCVSEAGRALMKKLLSQSPEFEDLLDIHGNIG